ncbi:hypothetical protein [Kitasatospora sp. DSM 101779]|jgi:hypothetical protein|uniref:hypothetical protein n=1 Tax=Kitasatospora sp. DSM 101779 TaxID=2853165 RepID=UPI0021DAFBB9|nr:hypothetical protein [Kitasatospora sp. DSM 101779]MCU7826971.1 hypothetical protein [Kitasatospora sp. DSM 101779]
MNDFVSVRRASLLAAAAASALFALAACDSPDPVAAGASASAAGPTAGASAVTPTAPSGPAPANAPGPASGSPSASAAAACGAPAGAAWVFVSSAAKTADGGADLAVSDTKVTCSPDGLDPVVEGAGGAGARTLHLAAGAAVHLLSPDNWPADATPADLAGLFAAHAAGRPGTGALGWKGSVFTVRLDGTGRIDFLGQGPWSALSTAPPK